MEIKCLKICIISFLITASPCLIYPCLNGGTCKEAGNNTYTCQCTEGYEGAKCEVEKTEENSGGGGLGKGCSNICSSL